MRFTLDSNILIYSVDVDTRDKHLIARNLLIRGAESDAILTVQALAEFLAVVRRKYPQYFDDALGQAQRWSEEFAVIPTSWAHVSAAARLSHEHGLQLWDCVIWQAARASGASIFVSEDLQDGLSLEGMTVLDPFKSGNQDRLARMLA